MSKLIPLSQGEFAIVDDADYDSLIKKNWSCVRDKSGVKYAYRRDWGEKRGYFMHRVILGTKGTEHTDHINHNGLDNRKSNLRICTNAQNQCNKLKSVNKSSPYKGVSVWESKYFVTQVFKDNRRVYIDYSKTGIEAAEKYDKKAIELFGEFAMTNKMLGLL